ncbi:MAG TPA: LPS export ABC transporter periplasmic protein LptC [Rhodanobacteraceae bacterium]|jgi:lipopolysaccharide export system protein LptC|nr:LPS export ABC transporter periplasmic protein LptC [Rhodanobacteraceae bacterium]
MTDRRLWLVAALLALAGVALNVVYWITRQPTNEQTYAGPPRSDYTLTDFTLNALDAEGKLSFQTVGPFLARRGDDGSIFVTTPDYIIYDGSEHQWKGKSDSAWVNKEGTIMRLDGHVEMHRLEDKGVQPVDVVTRDLTTWPKDKKMETSAPATITQPGSILRGVGMRGDLNTKVLELLSDVHATIEPKDKRKAAQQ